MHLWLVLFHCRIVFHGTNTQFAHPPAGGRLGCFWFLLLQTEIFACVLAPVGHVAGSPGPRVRVPLASHLRRGRPPHPTREDTCRCGTSLAEPELETRSQIARGVGRLWQKVPPPVSCI